MQDEARSIFLTTKGENPESIPKEMEAFLTFIREDTPANDGPSEDKFVKQLQKSIHSIKKNREMGHRYMLIQEYIQHEAEERAQEMAEQMAQEMVKKAITNTELTTRRQAVLELLEDLGTVNDQLYTRIMSEEDNTVLKAMHKQASKAISLEQFEESISNL